MSLMQGPDNWIWFLAECALSVLSVLAVWYVTIIGRDADVSKRKRGQDSSFVNSPLEEGTGEVDSVSDYGDGLREEHSPLPKFLICTYMLVGLWAVAYLISTGINGLI